MSVSASENVLGHWVHCYIAVQLAFAEIANTTAHDPCGLGPGKILGGKCRGRFHLHSVDAAGGLRASTRYRH